MGNRKIRIGDRVDIPMSAMIDVVFLLLIYFIVTYRETIPEAHLQVNLPAPDAAPREVQPIPPLEIQVLAREYRFRGNSMHPQTIRRALATLAAQGDPQDITLVVKTHINAPVANLIEILDICRAVNITNLNVMTLE